MPTSWKRNNGRKRSHPLFGNLIALIRRRLQHEPDDLRLRRSLATHLGRAGRFREAIEEAERLLRLAPDDAEARRILLGLKLNRLWRGEMRS
jgi:Flp pilus assembly protein TadD